MFVHLHSFDCVLFVASVLVEYVDDFEVDRDGLLLDVDAASALGNQELLDILQIMQSKLTSSESSPLIDDSGHGNVATLLNHGWFMMFGMV